MAQIDVVPSAVISAERRRDELQRRIPGLSISFSLVDLTASPVGALARAVRREPIDVALCHRTLGQLFNAEIAGLLAQISDPAVGARALVVDNQPAAGSQPANDDPTLHSALRHATRGLRNASHKVDLTAAPFNMDPIVNLARSVAQLNDGTVAQRTVFGRVTSCVSSCCPCRRLHSASRRPRRNSRCADDPKTIRTRCAVTSA
jgi:hypothetical protein